MNLTLVSVSLPSTTYSASHPHRHPDLHLPASLSLHYIEEEKKRHPASAGSYGIGGRGGGGWWWWLAQTACGLEGGREAEIILRSQALPLPPAISCRGPRCIILGARLPRISAVPETKVIFLSSRTTGRWPKSTYLLCYQHIISPRSEELITPMRLIFQIFIMYICSINPGTNDDTAIDF